MAGELLRWAEEIVITGNREAIRYGVVLLVPTTRTENSTLKVIPDLYGVIGMNVARTGLSSHVRCQGEFGKSGQINTAVLVCVGCGSDGRRDVLRGMALDHRVHGVTTFPPDNRDLRAGVAMFDIDVTQ